MALTDRVPLKDRTRGQWLKILTRLGIDRSYLNRKNGPCPLCCEGTDRWRFLDTNGDGTFVCNQCGSGSGITLAVRFLGLPFRETAKRIEEILGGGIPTRHLPSISRQQAAELRNAGVLRTKIRAIWQQHGPPQRRDPVDLWLRRRRVGFDFYPAAIRTGYDIRYYDDARSEDGFSDHPAMLALVSDPDGSPCTIHRTYLTWYGDKAAVDKPRKLYSGVTKGSAVRLAPIGPVLGIAEGIETALAASRLFGIPTWAALCANMLEKFKPPPEVKRLIIFGDNDTNQVGQRAAHALAARLAERIRYPIETEIQIPPDPGTDWNDVLSRGNVR